MIKLGYSPGVVFIFFFIRRRPLKKPKRSRLLATLSRVCVEPAKIPALLEREKPPQDDAESVEQDITQDNLIKDGKNEQKTRQFKPRA